MVVYNLKINKKLIIKFILILIGIVIITIGIIYFIDYLQSKTKKSDTFITDDYCIPSSEVAKIKPENYTNILKEVHEDIDTYIGQKISFDGYIYKLDNFNDNQFVLARDMDIGNNQTLIVGFLCEANNISEFEQYSWVTISGEITKGYYNNAEIPIITVSEIKNSEKPDITSVPLPDSEYVPTSVIY